MPTVRSALHCLAGVALGICAVALSAAGCAGQANCDDFGYCADKEPRGGAAGAGGAGSGGSPAGAGGISSGSGGTSSGGADACGNACGGDKPVCKADAAKCVECTSETQCAPPKRACDPSSNSCVECVAMGDCKDASKQHCDTNTHTCVACLSDADCPNADAARCEAGECTGCTDNTHCAHIAGKGVCDAPAGQCVECTGTDYSACGKDPDTETPRVCDSTKRICSTLKEHETGLCGTCVSDAQCKPGQLCVLQKFGTPQQDVGHFCFWKEGGDGKSNCLEARPYVKSIENARSIDGTVSNICGLRATTCIAHNQFSAKDCTTDDQPDDSLCGFAPGKDSKCVKFSGNAHLCTMRCDSYLDCKGDPGPDDGKCDTEAAPNVCKL